jgi:hypothetical protein
MTQFKYIPATNDCDAEYQLVGTRFAVQVAAFPGTPTNYVIVEDFTEEAGLLICHGHKDSLDAAQAKAIELAA